MTCRKETDRTIGLLLETSCSLHRRRESDGYMHIEASITPILQTVEAHVKEFEQLIQWVLPYNVTVSIILTISLPESVSRGGNL